MERPLRPKKQRTALEDPARVFVVGGGPAGAFFALTLLRTSRSLGRTIELLIFEKKRQLQFYRPTHTHYFREGCNYCAGGISPRLADTLEEMGLRLPEEIQEGAVDSLTVHENWKNIELPVPSGRKMLSAFRGSRPQSRPGRHANFDAFLLEKAVEEGATVMTAEVYDVSRSKQGKPVLAYWVGSGTARRSESEEADFVVFAGGVNQTPGTEPEQDCLFRALGRLIPGFRPPKVRKALICELGAEPEQLRPIMGELHFGQYGSKDLRIEMSSLTPKRRCITVALLGRSIDLAKPSDNMQIMMDFLNLPHVRRLLPKRIDLRPLCMCNPNMTVRAARNPFGHRAAVTGDMAVARLYKDGIYSAYLTACALANAVLMDGVDTRSLTRSYWPTIKRLSNDNWFGKAVFLLNRITFASPLLSRVLYQAVLTERKTRLQQRRRLGNLLWRIASGDDTYRHILLSMFHPLTLASIVVGGFLVTIRNYATELLFGLNWEGFGRHPTGIPKEAYQEKRRELVDVLGLEEIAKPPDFESVYTIKIKADRARILHQLGRFGDEDREYFTPRMVRVCRTAGEANQIGSVVQYDLPLRWLSFRVVLERVVEDRYLVYRVADGFAQGGVLVFDLDCVREGVCLLSIYVGFNFPKTANLIEKIGWRIFRHTFPGFVHDVLWNHSLCKIKDLAEAEELPQQATRPATGSGS